MASCVFCEGVDIKQRTIAESKTSFAFLTNIPITPGHTLVCPKRCVSRLSDLDAQELQGIFALVQKVKNGLTKTLEAEGFNSAWNEGKAAGQNVPHLHVHIVPRTKEDAGIYEHEPRRFLYRPGSREMNPEDELRTLTEELRTIL